MLLTPVGSAEFMAPEVLEAFIEESEEDLVGVRQEVRPVEPRGDDLHPPLRLPALLRSLWPDVWLE